MNVTDSDVHQETNNKNNNNDNNNNNNNNNTYIAPISILLFSSALKSKNISKHELKQLYQY